MTAADAESMRGITGDYREFGFMHGCWMGWLLAQAGRPAPAAGDALDPNHRPDLHYILGVLDRLAKAAPKDQELAAALNGMRYVVSRTDAAIAAQPGVRHGDQ
jgi:hypothetical protein